MLGSKLITAAAGAGGAAAGLGIEDVFSTWLYTGNDYGQTITNGIDLAGEGGLVWLKARTTATSHNLQDTDRGSTKYLVSDSNAAEGTLSSRITSFNSDGFSLGTNGNTNSASSNYASWTFRKAEKFFDVVTYAGDGVPNRQIAHNLGSTPGMIIVKKLDSNIANYGWYVWHRSLNSNQELLLNTDAAATSNGTFTAVTSTYFSPASSLSVNGSGSNYVAYFFAHDAGGFGDDGTESVIKCGAMTSYARTVDLGWEPQWVLVKSTSSSACFIIDSMRGWANGDNDPVLQPHLSSAEYAGANYGYLTPTGFVLENYYNSHPDVIYIAIRRGPMKTPTDATEVFSPLTFNKTTTPQLVGFPPDMWIGMDRNGSSGSLNGARLIPDKRLLMSGTATEDPGVAYGWDAKTDYWWQNNYNFGSPINWLFRRAPGFFDVVTYTGNGVAGRTVAHGLGVVPELMIVKRRDDLINWAVYTEATGNTGALSLNNNTAFGVSSAYWNNTSPTSSVFTVAASGVTNTSGGKYIAYLFATVPGVSKVGSYTGTAATLSIDCGFSAGARFVLIKRTDSTGDWYVWDTARGIVSGNDPYLLLNAYFAEVTNTDYIDPLSSGFQITSTAPAAINALGGSFIFLAIA